MSVLTQARGAAAAAFSLGAGYEPQPLGARFARDRVAGYPLDLSAKTRARDLAVTGGGVVLPLTPVGLAQRALGWWERHLAGEDGARTQFFELTHRLLERAERTRRSLVWRYDFDFAKYRLRAPWTSALAQGQAASVLVRAHLDTGEERYADAAAASLRALQEEPGLLRSTPHGPVLEEYPTERASHVLNGWIYALWGVWDGSLALEDASLRELFDASAGALAARINDYDLGWWTLYSQYPSRRRDLAKPFYHRLHAAQAHAMYQLTGRTVFAAAAERWQRYDRPLNVARAVAEKGAAVVAR